MSALLGQKETFCCLSLTSSGFPQRSQFGMHMEVLSWAFPSQTPPRGFSATQDNSLTSTSSTSPPGTVTGALRINFYILIIGSLETALGLWRETELPKNYLELSGNLNPTAFGWELDNSLPSMNSWMHLGVAFAPSFIRQLWGLRTDVSEVTLRGNEAFLYSGTSFIAQVGNL